MLNNTHVRRRRLRKNNFCGALKCRDLRCGAKPSCYDLKNMSLSRKILIVPIIFYQRYLSGLKHYGCCKYTPTCSQYALEAIGKYGPLKGLGLAIWRILRCNPFSKGGYDPVP